MILLRPSSSGAMLGAAPASSSATDRPRRARTPPARSRSAQRNSLQQGDHRGRSRQTSPALTLFWQRLEISRVPSKGCPVPRESVRDRDARFFSTFGSSGLNSAIALFQPPYSSLPLERRALPRLALRR